MEFLARKDSKGETNARRQLSLTPQTSFFYIDPRACLLWYSLLFCSVAEGKHGGMVRDGVTPLLRFSTSLKENGRVWNGVKHEVSASFNCTRTRMHATLFNHAWSMVYYKGRSAFTLTHSHSVFHTLRQGLCLIGTPFQVTVYYQSLTVSSIAKWPPPTFDAAPWSSCVTWKAAERLLSELLGCVGCVPLMLPLEIWTLCGCGLHFETPGLGPD